MAVDNKKITALYERLSRDDLLEGESVSIANQKAILETYAQQNGFGNIRHFSDDGTSGTVFNRPGLNAMLGEVNADNVAVVIIKDQSRIGREVVEVGLLKRTFDEYNVRFIAANDNEEQAWLETAMTELQGQIDAWSEDKLKTEKFIDLVKRYTDFTELTTPMLNELLDGKKSEKSASQVDLAKAFIKGLLALGDVPSKEVFAKGDAAGFPEATMKRAKSNLGVKSVRRGDEWFWVLQPDQGGQGAQESHGVQEPFLLADTLDPLDTLARVKEAV